MADINWPQAQRILDEVSNGGLITFLAGIPLREEGAEIVCGIGVSGSSVENDHMVAEAGAKALG